ncbi:hypothetical protein ACH3XW_48130 [Acanthocheilonema viteae]
MLIRVIRMPFITTAVMERNFDAKRDFLEMEQYVMMLMNAHGMTLLVNRYQIVNTATKCSILKKKEKIRKY